MILRWFTERPVAFRDQEDGTFLKPGESTPMKVKKLA
jgi:hypothetical protein